jgi:hypothetical protein
MPFDRGILELLLRTRYKRRCDMFKFKKCGKTPNGTKAGEQERSQTLTDLLPSHGLLLISLLLSHQKGLGTSTCLRQPPL